MAISFSVNCERAVLFPVKCDLDPPLPPSEMFPIDVRGSLVSPTLTFQHLAHERTMSTIVHIAVNFPKLQKYLHLFKCTWSFKTRKQTEALDRGPCGS